MASAKAALAEAGLNAPGRQDDVQARDRWEKIMADIEELLRVGSISESQAEVAVGCVRTGDEDVVLQRLQERYGQEQDATWLADSQDRPVAPCTACFECDGPDDGTPTVRCNDGLVCGKRWFHTGCTALEAQRLLNERRDGVAYRRTRDARSTAWTERWHCRYCAFFPEAWIAGGLDTADEGRCGGPNMASEDSFTQGWRNAVNMGIGSQTWRTRE